jgi:hypothetical protein
MSIPGNIGVVQGARPSPAMIANSQPTHAFASPSDVATFACFPLCFYLFNFPRPPYPYILQTSLRERFQTIFVVRLCNVSSSRFNPPCFLSMTAVSSIYPGNRQTTSKNTVGLLVDLIHREHGNLGRTLVFPQPAPSPLYK